MASWVLFIWINPFVLEIYYISEFYFSNLSNYLKVYIWLLEQACILHVNHSTLNWPHWFKHIWKVNSVQFSCSVMSDSSWPHGRQHTRPPCPSPTPRAYSNSCPLSWWRDPTISSSVVTYSFCLPSLPASASFPMSQLFTSGGQNIGVAASTSVLLMNIQDWFPLTLTALISLHSKGFWRVFNTTVQKHQFFSAQLSL